MQSEGPDAAGSLPALFKRTVRAHSDRVAICGEQSAFTFAELNDFANRLAHRLIAAGGASGDRVAVLMHEDLPSFAAMVGVLKAGRAVVILNPGDPPSRLGELVADCEPSVILTDTAHRETAAAIVHGGAVLVSADDDLTGIPGEDPEDIAKADDLAMLLYTSGTTGRPKGVMLSHGHMIRNMAVDVGKMRITPDDRILLVTSLWGGLGSNSAWVGFSSGARLVSYPANVNGVTGLAERMLRHRITIYGSAASLFRHFMKSIGDELVFPDVRFVRISSDPATSDDFDAFCRHFPNAKLVSAAGASEAGFLGWLELSPADKVATGRLPIGRPPEGTTLRIVDEAGAEVPPGAVGSIVIGSTHHALGYWRDPTLNTLHYSVRADGTQEFHSADLGWVDEQGRIVLAGRKDATHKIRGQRVDLSEVQRGLSEIPGVAAVAAAAVTRPNGELQLAAYVVAAPDAALTARRLRTIARGRMARHLVPTAFVFLKDMPRSANGKPDMARLRGMPLPSRATPAEPPRGETETLLVSIFEDAFDQDGIGRSDDFFELGGESLIAAVIAARVHAQFAVQLHFGAFVEHPVLSDLGAFIDSARTGMAPGEELPLVPTDRSRPLPLSLLQRSFWSPDQAAHNARRLTGAIAERIEGKLDITCFRDSVAEVIARHEILRTRFPVVDGDPAQIIEAPRPLELPLLDCSGFPDGEARAAALLESEGSRVFDVTAAPPISLSLVRTAPNVHWFILAMHHIIADAQSVNIMVQDIVASYAARIAGDRPEPRPLAIQFGDFAVWQRQIWRKEGRKLKSVVAWWQAQFEAHPAPTVFPLRSRPPPKPIQTSDWSIRWGLAPSTSKRLDDLGYREGATFYMVRLAGVVAVLAQLSGRDDAVIGGFFTNRNRLAYERMFGCFANRVVIGLACDRQASFRDLVGCARDHVAALHANAEIPYEQLVEEMAELGIKVQPPPVHIHVRTPDPAIRVAGLELARQAPTLPMPRAIVIRFDQFAEADNCQLTFDVRLVEKELMENVRSSLVRFFDAAAADPDDPVGDLLGRAGIDPIKWNSRSAGPFARVPAAERR